MDAGWPGTESGLCDRDKPIGAARAGAKWRLGCSSGPFGRPLQLGLPVDDQAEFSTESFIDRFEVPAPEAAAVLRALGYELGLDELWRPLSLEVLIRMNDWVANSDAFSTSSFAEQFHMPHGEARILLVGMNCHIKDGLWLHSP